MKMPTKFELNTENYKIYFNNEKKTHVCKSIETGEETNIGVLGILMQMGILKPVEDEDKNIQKLMVLSRRVDELENKLNNMYKASESAAEQIASGDVSRFEEQLEELKKPRKSRSEIKKRIMEKVLESTEEEKASDVSEESREELENWMEI